MDPRFTMVPPHTVGHRWAICIVHTHICNILAYSRTSCYNEGLTREREEEPVSPWCAPGMCVSRVGHLRSARVLSSLWVREDTYSKRTKKGERERKKDPANDERLRRTVRENVEDSVEVCARDTTLEYLRSSRITDSLLDGSDNGYTVREKRELAHAKRKNRKKV